MLKNFVSYIKTRKKLVIVFVLSTAISIFFIGSFSQSNEASAHPPQDLSIVTISGIVAILTSCITSIATFFGLIFTWAIGWRKENRETKMSVLERERLQTALERERLELEKLKAENKKLKKK